MRHLHNDTSGRRCTAHDGAAGSRGASHDIAAAGCGAPGIVLVIRLVVLARRHVGEWYGRCSWCESDCMVVIVVLLLKKREVRCRGVLDIYIRQV
jgi:hypothetical protein